MKLSRVKRAMHRRLAYLTARAAQCPETSPIVEERDALHTLLRCQGMLDEEQLERRVDACVETVLPAADRVGARARRGDELAREAFGLVERAWHALYGRVPA